jgi:nucleoside 2-deoxyribosyltransferase
MKKVYLASPLDPNYREELYQARKILEGKNLEVYFPLDHTVVNAWDYPNDEWGLMVFQSDVEAIKDCDYFVLLSYGRNSTAGSNWEAGFAFGIGKKVIIVEMTNEIMSLMVANGRYSTIKGLTGLIDYDFKALPICRTITEQK